MIQFKDVPNVICGVRIAMIPLLWVVAATHHPHAFVVLLAFTWATDALDGWLARTYHLESKLGARLDSIADNLVQLSMIGWLWLLRPELYLRFGILVGILFALFVISNFLQFIRKAPLHTYANKVTAFLVAFYLIYTFWSGVSGWFTWVTFLGLLYALVEGLLLLLTWPHVDENTKSIWRPPTAPPPTAE